MSRVVGVLLLAGAYLLVLGSVAPWDVAAGLLLGVVLTVLLHGRLPYPAGPAASPRCLLALPGLAGAVLLDVLRGTWDVALRVVGLRPLATPGIVTVPVGDRSPRGVAVTGFMVGLSPGSVLLDVTGDTMVFHVIDAGDPDAVRASVERFYTRHQRKVWP